MKKNKKDLKQAVKRFKEELGQSFCKGTSITSLTGKLVQFIDETLITLFNENHLHGHGFFSLLALGSYGRRELQLYSDVDLLLLHVENLPEDALQPAQAFIMDCWDAGLEVSHQLTTVKDCAKLASEDLTVLSSLLDARLLCGRAGLLESLHYQIHPLNMWTSKTFFYAKQHEQRQRDEKYGDTAYNLEPNIKHGPGGLRDIQTLLSIGKRHFGIQKLAEGIQYGFITDKEYEELAACQHFLWKVRFGLHYLTQKKEERLLFDYQVRLAQLFGFQDSDRALAIEQFMKLYFKHIKQIREINEMLQRWFAETILEDKRQQITALDSQFQLLNNVIEVTHDQVFMQNPNAMLELFLYLARKPEIKGVRAQTIRLIRQNLFLLTDTFKNSAAARATFIAIFKEGENPYNALRHMNRYGVLERYLDSFAQVTGQMQYDLFHAYTVDQHTLFVVRNLVDFLHPEFKEKFPLAHQLMQKIDKKHIVYLSALFHDIAKGRGGDHSELGAEDAKHFARHHNLLDNECELLVWLVRNHLLMSHTAQRRDIYDPQSITEFCQKLPHADYLDYLYLLTVADICATNPGLWNSWKDSLLKELHRAATQALRQEKHLLDERTIVLEKKQKALSVLLPKGVDEQRIRSLWKTFKGRYFLHEPPEIIALHTEAILTSTAQPLVMVMPHHSQGGTEVFIYMPHHEERFTIATTLLSNFRTTIQEAMISTCNNNYDLDIYIILDEKQQTIIDSTRQNAIQKALKQKMTMQSSSPKLQKRRQSQRQAHFNITPQITFTDNIDKNQTQLFLVSTDRPGLLAGISQVFFKNNLLLHNAKIATAGERVEDMFFLTTSKGEMLSDEEKKRLKSKLLQHLMKGISPDPLPCSG